MTEKTYAGNISVKQAWDKLSEELNSVLIDVRTEAELKWVGGPDLSGLGKETLPVQWKVSPGMKLNPDFIKQVSNGELGKDTPLLFLCRSGGRSAQAAGAMTAAGFTQCFNIEGGFEGTRDDDGHRGNVSGWKADGLPWQQG